MYNSPLFSKEYYQSNFFTKGERAVLNAAGGFSILPKESKQIRFKRFLTFKQDPRFKETHDKLKELAAQIKDKSGPLFERLKSEVHDRGPESFDTLYRNLGVLRKKMDKAGQLNFLSALILKIVNKVRILFQQSPLQLFKFAEINHGIDEFSFAPFPFNQTKWISPSFFFPDRNSTKDLLLALTPEDRERCVYSTTDSLQTEEIQKLERGLKNMWVFVNTAVYMPNHFIFYNLIITYKNEKFYLSLNNPKGCQSLPKNESHNFSLTIETLSGEETRKKIVPLFFQGALNIEIPLEKLLPNNLYKISLNGKFLNSIQIKKK